MPRGVKAGLAERVGPSPLRGCPPHLAARGEFRYTIIAYTARPEPSRDKSSAHRHRRRRSRRIGDGGRARPFRHRGRGLRSGAAARRNRRRHQCQPAGDQAFCARSGSASGSQPQPMSRPAFKPATCIPARRSTIATRPRWPRASARRYCTFHRADLLDALAPASISARIHLGRRLSGLDETSSGVALNFADGTKQQAELVIAADGVHSSVRCALYGDEQPAYTGQMVWRALLPGAAVPADVLEPSGHIQWLGSSRHLLCLLPARPRGGEHRHPARHRQWVEEGWSIPGDPA